MFCIHCGVPLPDGANFCPDCGRPQAGEIPPRETVPPAPAPAGAAAPPPVSPTGAVQTVQAVQGAAAAAGAVKKGFSLGKLLITLLLAGALSGGVFVVYREVTADPTDDIRETVSDFQTAYNRRDVMGMLDCFDPAYTAIYEGALSLVGDLAGFDVAALADGLFGLAAVLPPEAVGVDYPHLEVRVEAVNFLDDNNAEVTLTLLLSEGGESGSMTETVSMLQKDDEWYFSGEGIFW